MTSEPTGSANVMSDEQKDVVPGYHSATSIPSALSSSSSMLHTGIGFGASASHGISERAGVTAPQIIDPLQRLTASLPNQFPEGSVGAQRKMEDDSKIYTHRTDGSKDPITGLSAANSRVYAANPWSPPMMRQSPSIVH